MFRRAPLIQLAALALLAGGVSALAPAAAADPPTVQVSAAGTPSGTSAVQVTYTITVTGSVADAQVDTVLLPDEPIDPATVQVDSAPVPSGLLTTSGTTLTIRLGAGADTVNGGSLTGTHTVTYLQDRPTAARSLADTRATFRYDNAGTPASVTSASVTSAPVTLAHPDLALGRPTAQAGTGALGTGRTGVYRLSVTDYGPSAASATLSMSMPAGLLLDPDLGVRRVDGQHTSPVTCTGTKTASPSCAFGAVNHGQQLAALVYVRAQADSRAGTSGTLTVNLAPGGEPDQHGSDNHVTATVQFAGTAALKLAVVVVKPGTSSVKVGRTTVLSLRITNNGPATAGNTSGVFSLPTGTFSVVSYSPHRSGQGTGLFPVSSGSSVRVLEWAVGSVRAHSTVYAHVTVKAVSTGDAPAALLGQSDAGDPACDSGSGSCGEYAQLTLHGTR